MHGKAFQVLLFQHSFFFFAGDPPPGCLHAWLHSGEIPDFVSPPAGCCSLLKLCLSVWARKRQPAQSCLFWLLGAVVSCCPPLLQFTIFLYGVRLDVQWCRYATGKNNTFYVIFHISAIQIIKLNVIWNNNNCSKLQKIFFTWFNEKKNQPKLIWIYKESY